jgi:hypothetical protein
MTTFTSEDREEASKCNPHPDAPHGFMRNESHNAGRYVCECEFWNPEKCPWDEWKATKDIV